ncbi:MAG: superoxide dismutase [Candidatus Paceibacterota bacterium]
MYEQKPLPFDKELDGISKKTNDIHYGKLYKGYVDKANEINEKLGALRKEMLSGEEPGGNQTYSKLRALKQGETFAVNGIYLHEWFFGVLGGDGDHSKGAELVDAINAKWGSVEDFIKYFTEAAMAARGWAILAWDPKAVELKQYNGDVHNQAVWGAMPVIALDVYEHAYFIDHGSDRKAYIQAFFKNLDWAVANEFFKKASAVTL